MWRIPGVSRLSRSTPRDHADDVRATPRRAHDRDWFCVVVDEVRRRHGVQDVAGRVGDRGHVVRESRSARPSPGRPTCRCMPGSTSWCRGWIAAGRGNPNVGGAIMSGSSAIAAQNCGARRWIGIVVCAGRRAPCRGTAPATPATTVVDHGDHQAARTNAVHPSAHVATLRTAATIDAMSPTGRQEDARRARPAPRSVVRSRSSGSSSQPPAPPPKNWRAGGGIGVAAR